MTARLDGQPRADKGKLRKYATIEERLAARKAQRAEIQRRYREKNRETLRAKSKVYRDANAELCIQRTVAWQRANPEKVKDYVYKKKYGITLTEYQRMVAERDGRCDICKRQLPLVVDHCHASSSVRGLLCDRCNVAIGCFEDDTQRMDAAKKYLRRKHGAHA